MCVSVCVLSVLSVCCMHLSLQECTSVHAGVCVLVYMLRLEVDVRSPSPFTFVFKDRGSW